MFWICCQGCSKEIWTDDPSENINKHTTTWNWWPRDSDSLGRKPLKNFGQEWLLQMKMYLENNGYTFSFLKFPFSDF